MATAIKHKIGNIEVRTIPDKGRGVFATKYIREGAIIEVSPVIFIPSNEEQFVYGTILANYTFGLSDGQVIALGYASLYNHSFEHNAEFFVTDKTAIVKSLRDIKEGEEITFDYGWEEEDYRLAGIR